MRAWGPESGKLSFSSTVDRWCSDRSLPSLLTSTFTWLFLFSGFETWLWSVFRLSVCYLTVKGVFSSESCGS